MGEPDRCDISAVAVESRARPVDEPSAGFLDLLPGNIGLDRLPMNADPAGSALPSPAKSDIGFDGLGRLAFDAWRGASQFLPVRHDGEAKPTRGCRARTARPSGGGVGAAVLAQEAYDTGLDNASVCRGQSGRNGTGDGKRRSGRLASTSMPIPRRAPKESWQRKAASRGPRDRLGHSARELVHNVPRRDRSRGLHGFLYGGRFKIPHPWQDNRLLGLDPFDWFVLLGGSALSGAIVWLS
jgi:hypothetical protein